MSTLRQRYGLYGYFDGDDKLEERTQLFEEGTNVGEAEHTFERLKSLTNNLLPKGRCECSTFVATNLTLCDSILTMLLDYCIVDTSTDTAGNNITINEDLLYIDIALNSAPSSAQAMISTTTLRMAHHMRYSQW